MGVYGIDLGTTNSAIARIDADGRPEVLIGMSGESTVPSVVLFASAFDHLVGEGARRQARLDPEHVCSLVKRRMGDAQWRFAAHGETWSAPAVSALILKSLAADAEFGGGEPVRRAVITVPAYFGDEERRATIQAGTYAGLDVAGVLSEPIAAAFSYGFGRLDGSVDVGKGGARETVLVYDLGGGTFDATVIELADRRISVLAVEGDHQLGGADWDERIALYLSQQFCAANPDAEDPLDDSAGSQMLVLAAERAKRELSEADSTEVVVAHDGVRAVVTLTRDQLESMTASLLRRTIDLTRDCLEAAAKRGITHVDRLLLVGGSSRMPMVARELKNELGLVGELRDPDLSVARGAALYGEKLEMERLIVADLVTRGRLRDGATLNEAAPADLEQSVSRVAASFGQPVSLVRRMLEIQVDTVVSRGFGVLALDSHYGLAAAWLVHRNQTLPVRVRRSFGTVREDQDQIELTIVEQQGQAASVRPEDTKVLVEGRIRGIPPGYPAGSEVRVTFEMGFDGVLHVTAHHVDADMPLTLSAQTGATLSQSEVARELDQVQRTRRRDS
ncbi:Hsp70 family protein [Nocardia puris]|uniref:Molecular chaperone DnaK (HSP70) n=1 Tax=Nocardia puris TaxID=208602 RepID=A0A366E2L3_9NOCA|nr:Hsp70 family protein [Nocardia puris]MBF6212576.1 Hsp70 family protein [Nocardia puris]MBF6369156.1 Hsp70 family protein [Nocardia puris]MBF6461165.1 Hsp70 family protein [Nocardia puris]RBO96610.1 molecular chaperone DnaK (HSP70) [Nocardia puris]